ncbi:hypothetical protein HanIR_Chr15g0746741 [Helianthus annuus]|nr:hypothetical protein HanIR_Chr15g0746741 [Helianthus annuus]
MPIPRTENKIPHKNSQKNNINYRIRILNLFIISLQKQEHKDPIMQLDQFTAHNSTKCDQNCTHQS